MKINCHCHIFSLDFIPLEFRKRFVLNVKDPRHRFVHEVFGRFWLAMFGCEKRQNCRQKCFKRVKKVVEGVVHVGRKQGV